MTSSNMDLDLPVDPNEPTYCICNQVSFGEMVACDNNAVWLLETNVSFHIVRHSLRLKIKFNAVQD